MPQNNTIADAGTVNFTFIAITSIFINNKFQYITIYYIFSLIYLQLGIAQISQNV